MEIPARSVLVSLGCVIVGLLALHLLVTNGTGALQEPNRSALAITPATTITKWWRHLWAGFFHHSWGHIAYNLAVFAIAFPFAARQMSPALTLANAYWIGPFTVFALHILLVLPLAKLGLPYAVSALNYPLVGFSVMTYSIVGAATTLLEPVQAAAVLVGIVGFEIVLALLVTGPFIGVYHVGGLLLGYWVRILLLDRVGIHAA